MRLPHDESTAGIIARFDAQDIAAMYGGRSKGNGFWLAGVSGEQPGASYIDGLRPIANNGEASGNPFFWMRDEAIALLKRIETHPRNTRIPLGPPLTDGGPGDLRAENP